MPPHTERMAEADVIADRGAFAERLRVQIASRYRDAAVEVDPEAFALRIGGSGGATLSLAPLHQACVRTPSQCGRLIAGFVASVEKQLSGHATFDLSVARLLWCVRSSAEIGALKRAGDLLSVALGAGLTAFVAEALPASIMRGVPRQDWEGQGLDERTVREAADRNTERHFAAVLERIRGSRRVPADGWRLASDPLFAGSALMVPAVLRALHDLAHDEVLLAVPDRGLVLAIAVHQPGAERFQRRVLREWREAMHPCSRDLLLSDGSSLHAVPRRGGRVGTLVMPWLQE